MIINVQNVVAGEEVFLFYSHGKYPTVVKVTRATQNFVFIERTNSEGATFETKFRRDGSGMERFDGRLCTIESGDVEKIDNDKKNDARIAEILCLLNDKGFKYNGHPQWYTIEQWEKLASAFTS